MVLVVDKLRRSVADEMYPYRRQRHRGLHLTVLVIIFNLLTIPRVERDFAKDPEGAGGWRLLTVQQRCILGYRPRVYVYDNGNMQPTEWKAETSLFGHVTDICEAFPIRKHLGISRKKPPKGFYLSSKHVYPL